MRENIYTADNTLICYYNIDQQENWFLSRFGILCFRALITRKFAGLNWSIPTHSNLAILRTFFWPFCLLFVQSEGHSNFVFFGILENIIENLELFTCVRYLVWKSGEAFGGLEIRISLPIRFLENKWPDPIKNPVLLTNRWGNRWANSIKTGIIDVNGCMSRSGERKMQIS